jgi:hypothetical protein
MISGPGAGTRVLRQLLSRPVFAQSGGFRRTESRVDRTRVNTHRRPRWAWFFDPYGRTQVWRSVETWPRRDSFLLVGLLLLVDYLLVALFIFVSLNSLGRVALVLGTIPILLFTVAEALHGFRPTRDSLARADPLALIAIGTVFAIGLIITLADLVTGQLG